MYNPPFTSDHDIIKTISPYTNRDTDSNSALSKVTALNAHEDTQNVMNTMQGDISLSE